MSNNYPKTKLDEQKRIIADWMAANNLTADDVAAPLGEFKPRPWRNFVVTSPYAAAKKAAIKAALKPDVEVNTPVVTESVNPVVIGDRPQIGKCKPFTGVYVLKGKGNTAKRVLSLLEQYEYMDVEAYLTQYGLNRQAFLATVKKLEQVGLVKMIRADQGKTSRVYYLERAA